MFVNFVPDIICWEFVADCSHSYRLGSVRIADNNDCLHNIFKESYDSDIWLNLHL